MILWERFRRRWISNILIALASLSVLAATTAWWVHETVLDTDRFMEVVEPVIESPATAEATGRHLATWTFDTLQIEERVTTVFESVEDWLRQSLLDLAEIDPEGAIGSRLPEASPLSDLAQPLVSAAQLRVEQTITDWVGSDEFRAALAQTVRISHQGAVAVIREDQESLPEAVILDGDVILDLAPVAAEALTRVTAATADFLGIEPPADATGPDPEERLRYLSERLGVEIPDDFGQLVILSEEQLEPYRNGLAAFDRLVWLAIALAVVTAVGAVLTAPDRVAGTVWLGVGVIATLLLTWPARALITERIVDGMATTGGRQTAADVIDAATTGLRNLALVIIVVAALVVAVALWRAYRQPAVGDS